jgi:DNA-binding HxlR family transcriptional regulator
MQPHTKDECPKKLMAVRDALTTINGKWKIPIMTSLSFGNKRFTAIQKDITGISPKMLSKELRELELNQLVKRTVYDSLPPLVEYSLTTHGKSMDKMMDALLEWGEKHRKKIIAGK